MTPLIQDYKNAMRHMVQSVSILTYQHDGHRMGVTVTSASSYSAEPPIFMAAIHRESTLAGHLSLGNHLCMNLLKSDALELAKRFSGATGVHGVERFEAGAWEFDEEHAPRLQTALCSFRGELRALIPQASHALLLVEIRDIVENSGTPLSYYMREYQSG